VKGSTAAAPITGKQRIAVLDVLRGFAIFGILLVNMQGFSSTGYRADDGERLWPAPADRIAESLISYGATGKFMILFTVLFGLSVSIQMERSTASGHPFLRLQLRRLLVLLAIGLVHAHLIWFGDILVSYALAGLLLLLFRRCRLRTILVWAIVLNILSFAQLEIHTLRNLGGDAREELTAGIGPASAPAAVSVYAHGSFAEVTRQRTHDFWNDNADLHNIVARRLSFFLLGLYIGRLGILGDVRGHRRLLRTVLRRAVVIGVLAHLAGYLLSLQGLPAWMKLLRLPLTMVGNPAMACAYAVGVVLLFQRSRVSRLVAPLAAVGRAALSNYLLQSLICTAIFYRHGFGLHGQVGPAAGMALSVVIFSLQAPASAWWLRRFRFGPVEWVWRSLTYGRLQPMRVESGRGD
jgi:uncharacterized protein